MICPPQSREPVRWAAILIVSSYFVNRGDRLRTLTAALFLLCFDGYFRPSFEERLSARRGAGRRTTSGAWWCDRAL